MKILKPILLSLLFLIIFYNSKAQLYPVFKLDIYSGLPSNHVYMTLKDKLGYLWIATDKGLAKYNGYSIELFSSSTGLPYDDVYGLFMDKKERLWLYGFATSVGYIYHNKYHSIPLNNKGIIVNPRNFCDYDDGILFNMSYENNNIGLVTYKNDTVRKLFAHIGDMITTPGGYTLSLGGDGATEQEPVNIGIYKYEDGDIIPIKKSFNNPEIDKFVKSYSNVGVFKNYILFLDKANNTLSIANLESGDFHTIPPFNDTERVSYIFGYKEHLYIVYDKHILKQDSTRHPLDTLSLEAFTKSSNISGLEINYFLEDSFWKNCIATSKKGLYFNSSYTPAFTTKETGLRDYTFVGYGNDTMGYWWNSYSNTLAQVTDNGKVTYKKMPFTKKPERIVRYDATHAVALAEKLYILRNKDMQAMDMATFTQAVFPQVPTYRGIDASVTADQTIYAILSSGVFKYQYTSDTIMAKRESPDRFKGIISDDKRGLMYAYHREKVVVYAQGKQPVSIPGKTMKHFGISSIEQILTDNRYGNIIVKDRNGLICIHPETHNITRLLPDLNLTDAKIVIRHDSLIVAGRFGILFSRVNGICSFTPPVHYTNYKDWHYTYIYDMQVLNRQVWLKTDKGFYSVKRPAAINHEDVANNTNLPYRLIASYNDTSVIITRKDTLRIDQQKQKILFDIINPAGNGQPEYSYRINGADWQQLNANEVNLQGVTPGRYYRLGIKAGDNTWYSRAHNMYVYVIPEWWQTPWGRRLLSLAALVLLFGTAYLAIIITRQRMAKKNAKRNRLLELELKSIYSQINPHFIFNTLNGALQFIKRKKTDDAYNHIFKFSSLLRSYLNTSRKRLISIAAETENLRNYIELQQTRFDHIFTYRIINTIADDVSIYIPTLLLQPLVENAINHGLLPKNDNGHLEISFSQDQATGRVTCIVEDNGIGLHAAMHNMDNDPIKRESHGSRLVEELIALHNEYEEMDISIRYEDKAQPEQGTSVYIIINNPRYNEKV